MHPRTDYLWLCLFSKTLCRATPRHGCPFTMGSVSPASSCLNSDNLHQTGSPLLMNTHIIHSESDSPYWAAFTSGGCLLHFTWTLDTTCWFIPLLKCYFYHSGPSLCVAFLTLLGLVSCMGTGLTLFELWHPTSNNNPPLWCSHLLLYSGSLTSILTMTASPSHPLQCGQLPCPVPPNDFRSVLLRKCRRTRTITCLFWIKIIKGCWVI